MVSFKGCLAHLAVIPLVLGAAVDNGLNTRAVEAGGSTVNQATDCKYPVKLGDYCSLIAGEKFDFPLSELLRLNPGLSHNGCHLRPKQILTIPCDKPERKLVEPDLDLPCVKYYRVKDKEGCWEISKSEQVSLSKLTQWNELDDESTVSKDQDLCVSKTQPIACGKPLYTVESGDSCPKIARKFNVTLDELSSLNPPLLGTRCSIFPGHKICHAAEVPTDTNDATGSDDGVKPPTPTQGNGVQPAMGPIGGFNTTVQPVKPDVRPTTPADRVIIPLDLSVIMVVFRVFIGNETEQDGQLSDAAVMMSPARMQAYAEAIESAKLSQGITATGPSPDIQTLQSIYWKMMIEVHIRCLHCPPGTSSSQRSSHAAPSDNQAKGGHDKAPATKIELKSQVQANIKSNNQDTPSTTLVTEAPYC